MNIDTIILTENFQTMDQLYPFNLLHSASELRCGAFHSFEKISRLFPSSKIIVQGRTKQSMSMAQRFPGIEDYQSAVQNNGRKKLLNNVLVIDASVLPLSSVFKQITEICEVAKTDSKTYFTSSGKCFACFFTGETEIESIQKYISTFDNNDFNNDNIIDKNNITSNQNITNFKNYEILDVKYIKYLWNTLDFIADCLDDDKQFFETAANLSEYEKSGVHFVNKNDIYLGKNVKIAPGTVIDASEGVVILQDNATVMHNSVIMGPVSIGKYSTIKAGAKIYGKTSIGEHCKVGGEVENSILQGYSNKQHDGFLGHSFVSEWVNLGADTNTSDLKNNYSDISVQLENKMLQTGRRFLGTLFGDHVKTAINTMLSTGTVIGVAANIFCNGFPAKSIPSFSWVNDSNRELYNFDKFIETAHIVTARRNRQLCDIEIDLLKEIYDNAIK